MPITCHYLPLFLQFLHLQSLQSQLPQSQPQDLHLIVLTFKFGVFFAVSKALIGDFLLTDRASFKRRWLRRRPVFLGLLCFLGSGTLCSFLIRNLDYNITFFGFLQGVSRNLHQEITSPASKLFSGSSTVSGLTVFFLSELLILNWI